MKQVLILLSWLMASSACALGRFGDWTCSVALSGYTSAETGKAPNAYLWIPEGCAQVRFAVLAQQNMTEEAVLRSPVFRDRMAALGGAVIWVAPWFSQNWEPSSGCQQTFEEMMVGLAGQSGHKEMTTVPIVPFGHSAQATFPWNFAAWNNERTLCIVSFHGDAPRTNLCGYGAANVEWGRNRNIDGIPGLMVEGEYEWWEARVRPALAFRMMYPESCISFLCDAGAGHFYCSEETIEYIALFIQKACEQRLQEDGTLKKINPKEGWLVSRFVPDLPQSDGADKGKVVPHTVWKSTAAPYPSYADDVHESFWYPDEEMARLTEARYVATLGKQQRKVGVLYQGKLVPCDAHSQGGLKLHLGKLAVGDRFTLQAVLIDVSREEPVISLGNIRQRSEKALTKAKCRMIYICGPVRQVDDTTFELVSYDCGTDNPRRSSTIWLAAVAEGDDRYKRAVQPIECKFSNNEW